MQQVKSLMMVLFIVFVIMDLHAQGQKYDYAKVLEKSIMFYECQQSGKLPSWNRITWRGTSALNDGKDAGKDLTGGWYDAGDNVKFGLPMAGSAQLLALGVVEYEEVYTKTNQMQNILNNLRFVNDYFIKCHTAPKEFYGQVGDGNADHGFWGAPEIMTMNRPSFKIDETHPGSDLAGETAAAMATASIAFKKSDAAYSATLLTHAKQLYDFADKCRGKYTDAIQNAANFYQSWSGYKDELVWAAIWLFKATGDSAYFKKAELYYDSLNKEDGKYHNWKWSHCWDDKGYGCYVYLAKMTGNVKYKEDAERWLDYWTIGYENQKIKYSPGGLASLDQWGALRYAANTSLFALIYRDYLAKSGTEPEKMKRYYDFAVKQLNYILGDNPLQRSFVCDFGKNPPVNPHHRAAHGSTTNNINNPVNNLHILPGALVGGPDANDQYKDDRNDFRSNEVACDYNAAFTGAMARMALGATGISSKQLFPGDQSTLVFHDRTNNVVRISLECKKNEHVKISIFTISGKEIACIADNILSIGNHQFNYATVSVSPGIYLVGVTRGAKTQFNKIQLVMQ